MLHLLGQGPLAIEERHFYDFYNRYLAGNQIDSRQITKTPVEMIASATINNYTQRELRWLGIDTVEGKDGLVAVLTTRGATQRYGDYYSDGTEWLTQQIALCNGNPLVNAMLWRVDSPGGQLNGSQNMAASVRDSVKPIVGFGTNMVGSAAFWAFSQCLECYLENEITAAGSIGTMSVYVDKSEALAKAGEKYLILRSAGAEDKNALNGIEAFEGEYQQKAIIQEQKVLDASRKIFLQEVQQKRVALTTDPGGSIFYGKEAVKIGLADGLMSFENALKRADVLGLQYKRKL